MVRWFRTGTGYRTGRINKHNVVRCCFFFCWLHDGGRGGGGGGRFLLWSIFIPQTEDEERVPESLFLPGWFRLTWLSHGGGTVSCPGRKVRLFSPLVDGVGPLGVFFFLTLLRTVGRSAFGGDKNYCVSCKRKLLAPRWWKSYLGRKKERCVVRPKRQKVML